MSQWTHVCGCVRIDSLEHESVNSRIETVFGKTVCWGSPTEMWGEQENYPELYTPTGSEGGIQYDVWENPKKYIAASHSVSIFGDLRDYNNVEEIIEWFNKICKAFVIRDAVLNIEVEYIKTVTLVYDGEDKPCRIIEKPYEREVI